MQLINRDCLVLKSKQTFVDWICSVPGLEMPEVTLAEVNVEEPVLLVPEGRSEEDAEAYLARLKLYLVEMHFSDWYRDESTWPDFVKYPFDHWISVEYHSMVYDMAVDTAFVHDPENELDEWCSEFKR